jgi:hypothetical protein
VRKFLPSRTDAMRHTGSNRPIRCCWSSAPRTGPFAG